VFEKWWHISVPWHGIAVAYGMCSALRLQQWH
jgi:hypothetical protein